jgi:hypothetical protein
MSKDKPRQGIIPIEWEKTLYGFVPLAFCLCCGLTLLGGCRTVATEARVRVCVAEPGVPLPPECFGRNTDVSTEARDPGPE